LVVTSMRNAARAIPQVWSKTFSIGIVLLEILQAVKDLGDSEAAGFTTIKSIYESHMAASETACRQFGGST